MGCLELLAGMIIIIVLGIVSLIRSNASMINLILTVIFGILFAGNLINILDGEDRSFGAIATCIFLLFIFLSLLMYHIQL